MALKKAVTREQALERLVRAQMLMLDMLNTTKLDAEAANLGVSKRKIAEGVLAHPQMAHPEYKQLTVAEIVATGVEMDDPEDKEFQKALGAYPEVAVQFIATGAMLMLTHILEQFLDSKEATVPKWANEQLDTITSSATEAREIIHQLYKAKSP